MYYPPRFKNEIYNILAPALYSYMSTKYEMLHNNVTLCSKSSWYNVAVDRAFYV